ncbi:TetR/AcrR family transcriptional regulator [Bordetella genomosp. 1]|uniref:TetR family transcriptional regulator n=1 Tax=Bordetella genomosp. 1 TaxID=1395607 RepID=A0ABX4EZ07_9BORD|nr:TetR/AcrR family transcriptional regulator [Bordetella genomosp. 1]OZI64992.1 TetR family transcriptional regulator [Bordetella genomosp. 1]
MSSPSSAPAATRRRLTRADRRRQLLDTAWSLVRAEGTDLLSLGRLADAAGVAKPVVYDHFGTRAGLLAALYEEYDARQNAAMDAALAGSPATLAARAAVIAAAYVDCVMQQGREIPGVTAALAGSPELDAIKRDYVEGFMEKCRQALAPFAPGATLDPAGLWVILGAAESLSQAAAAGQLSAAQARDALAATLALVCARGGSYAAGGA